MAEEVALKRRRVTQACESCRSLKSKCDGRRPVCGRCRGYGYECKWRDRDVRNGISERRMSLKPSDDKDEIETLRRIAHASQGILSRVQKDLSAEDQRTVDGILSSVESLSLGSPVVSPSSGGTKSLELLEPFRRSRPSAHRYLGEISDVSFFNSVKDLLQNDSIEYRAPAPLESYEREATESSNTAETSSDSTVPDRISADKYVTIYFSTIHIAYPFIDRKRFMEDYDKYWDSEQRSTLSSTSLALLFTIFAIGCYYDICSMSTEQPGGLHYACFQRALAVASSVDTDYSVDNVRILLVQCFYLLLAQWTDRCWLTLGLAIRIAQSLGLHIERGQSQSNPTLSHVATELHRRTWHSLYVLDRLLSLQLGRPSAIRSQDCTTRLPSRLDDGDFDIARDIIPPGQEDEPRTGDYFIAVIRLSSILRHVERDVYRPTLMDYSEDMLHRTEGLDAELLKWKSQLPRWLRFDRGHTFERSSILKRQRNMLAIKFHHLRALIHRPYLCLPWLQRNDNKIKTLLDSNAHKVVYFERLCVQAAQETAHLLHDVTDKKALVEDFPWWQMISCLICASSILLVMRAFTPSTNPTDEAQREVLEEDANTCLKVFDALSPNSDGARRARDMLQNLRDTKLPEQAGIDAGVSNHDIHQPLGHVNRTSWPQEGPSGGSEDSPSFATIGNPEPMDDKFSYASMWNRQDWPSEIADSMAWSSQFVDAWDLLDLTPDQV